jgi:hypothetical protein
MQKTHKFAQLRLLIWAGVTPLLDAWWRRCDRSDLAGRLPRFQSSSVAGEAQVGWTRKPEGGPSAGVIGLAGR